MAVSGALLKNFRPYSAGAAAGDKAGIGHSTHRSSHHKRTVNAHCCSGELREGHRAKGSQPASTSAASHNALRSRRRQTYGAPALSAPPYEH